MPKPKQPGRSKKLKNPAGLLTIVQVPSASIVPPPPQHSIPHVDITGATVVEVDYNKEGTILWVNINGICALRCCQIKSLSIK